MALLFLGCRREEITTSSVPKDSPPPPAASANGAINRPAVAPNAAPLTWTAPAGWQEQPASGMRVGSFIVSKGDQRADVSVIPLAGISGSEIDNVNRWRGQVGLPPVDAAKLAEVSEKITIGNTPASLYDMAGTDPQTKQPARILAASLSSGGMTWFFKMVGADALVAEEKPKFKEFLKSVTSADATVAQDQLPPSHPPVNGTLQPAMAGIASAAMGVADKPTWQVPAGWQEQPPTSMRVATFQVAGDKGAKADVSVIKLAGDAGGMLANLNRWRGQVGLPGVSEADLPKLTTTREVNGVNIVFAEMAGQGVESGEPARLLAAVVPQGDSTWFYKLFGNDPLVAQHKPAFIKFVETARYSNAP